MTTQPEALRLADLIRSRHGNDLNDEAATELRRLHQFAEDQIGRATAAEAALQMTKATHALKLAAVEAQRDALLERADTLQRWYDQQLDRLAAVEAQRDALLEALQRLCSTKPRYSREINADWDNARAAIAKAEGEKE